MFPLTAGPNAEVENYIVIQTEDFRTRLLLPEVLPQASVVETITEPDGTVYANVYTRPAGSLPARPPQHVVDVALNDAIRLEGYDVQPPALHPGEILYLQLHWRVQAAVGEDWTVFTHLLRRAASDSGRDSYEQVAGSDGLARRRQPAHLALAARLACARRISDPASGRSGAWNVYAGCGSLSRRRRAPAGRRPWHSVGRCSH